MKATALRKRLRREAHEKENKRREREGISPETTPESTPEASSSSGGVDFSDSEDLDTEVARGSSPVQQWAGVETSALAVGEKRPAPATIWEDARAEGGQEVVHGGNGQEGARAGCG